LFYCNILGKWVFQCEWFVVTEAWEKESMKHVGIFTFWRTKDCLFFHGNGIE
jgi:hypothetical protein